jgi:hypothetical protein
MDSSHCRNSLLGPLEQRRVRVSDGMLLLQVQHGDEVGVSFGLARFILP